MSDPILTEGDFDLTQDLEALAKLKPSVKVAPAKKAAKEELPKGVFSAEMLMALKPSERERVYGKEILSYEDMKRFKKPIVDKQTIFIPKGAKVMINGKHYHGKILATEQQKISIESKLSYRRDHEEKMLAGKFSRSLTFVDPIRRAG
jgi:hypothetical protein